jgi:hypothetical protein
MDSSYSRPQVLLCSSCSLDAVHHPRKYDLVGTWHYCNPRNGVIDKENKDIPNMTTVFYRVRIIKNFNHLSKTIRGTESCS